MRPTCVNAAAILGWVLALGLAARAAEPPAPAPAETPK